MSKVCSKCKIEKDDGEFYANKASVDGLDYYCKECRKLKTKERTHNKSGDLAEYIKQYHSDNREFVESLKTPCCKCGEDRPWIIQFHHIDYKSKKFEVSQFGTHGRRAIWEEASKCVCLCSNCHDEFHYFFGKNPDDPVDALDKYINEDF